MFAQSQGIQGLPSAQQAPGQGAGMAPGQAAPQQVVPQKQSATPASKIAALESQLIPLSPGNAAMLEQRKMQLMQMYAQEPTIELLERLTKTAEAIKTANAQTQQQAMAAYAQQGPQTVADMVRQDAMATTPAAQGGIMQGFSGGGAVAFQSGGRVQHFANGSDPFGLMSDPATYLAADTLRVETAQRNEQIRALQEQLAFLEQAGAPQAAAVRVQLERLQGKMPQAVATEVASETQRLKARPTGIMGQIAPAVPPRAPRPGTGRPTTPAPAPAPAAAAPTPEVTPAPKTDNWADIEQQGLKGIAALQDVYRKQSEVDPELARLRGAAYESAQSIAQRRERDRLAALEAAQKAATAPLMDNQEALLRLAGSIGGKMRFGEALGAMAGTAGGIRGEQRKALEAAQRESRLEQNAIDQLNQALAEKRVADRSGDVDRMRAADTKVAEAQLKVTELRSSVQEKRATDADRAEQRALTKRGQDITQQTAREQMANAVKVAGMQADRTPAEVRLMEWLRDPENKKLYESIQSSKREDDRLLKLYEIYTKNKLMLGNMSFEEFASGLKGASAGGAAPSGKLKYNPATGKIE